MAITVNDFETLRRLPLFEGLSGEVVSDLLGNAVARHYARRTTLFMQGDAADRFFVVFGGWVKVYRQLPDGAEAVIEVFGPGESFAEAAVFGDGEYPASAEVVSDARLLEIPSDHFKRRLAADTDLLFRMLATLSARLKRFVHRTEQLTTCTASQRVAAFLLRFCLSQNGGGTTKLKLPYDKLLIAGRLGMKPETFSRTLTGLRDYGIFVEGSDVRIEDPQAVARYVNQLE